VLLAASLHGAFDALRGFTVPVAAPEGVEGYTLGYLEAIGLVPQAVSCLAAYTVLAR
jgi:hypothetical protein